MTGFADFEPLKSAEGVTFTPWTDGHAVGFRITRESDDRVEYVHLSPSSEHNRSGWDGRGDVFVYHAAADPGVDVEDDVYGSPACYINVFDPADYEPMRTLPPRAEILRVVEDPHGVIDTEDSDYVPEAAEPRGNVADRAEALDIAVGHMRAGSDAWIVDYRGGQYVRGAGFGIFTRPRV